MWARNGTFATTLRAQWRWVALGWTIPTLAWFLLRWLAFENPAPVIPRLVDNVAQVGLVLTHYFGKTVIPISLRTVADLNAPLSPGLLVIAAIVGVLTLVRPARMLWVGLSWFALMVYPTLLSGHDFYLEARLYAPLVGLLLFLLHTLNSTKFHEGRIGQVVLSTWVVLFAVTGFNRSQQFADRSTLWESAVAQSPHSAFAANNLGAVYFLDRQFGLARQQFERTLELNPDEPMARNNLGLVHYQLQDFETARTYYEAEIDRNPWYADSHYNLGVLWARLNQLDDAVQEWEAAVAVDPDYPAPYEMLARYHRARDPERFRHYVGELRRLGLTLE